MHERVAERLDHGAVELGVLADQLELDLLAELAREVADEAREAQEDGLDRDHPDLHDHRLQGVRGAGQVLHRLREARHVGVGGERLDQGAVQDELAHGVHELVEALGVDADGRGGLLPWGPAGGFGLGRGGRLVGGGLVGDGLVGDGLAGSTAASLRSLERASTWVDVAEAASGTHGGQLGPPRVRSEAM